MQRFSILIVGLLWFVGCGSAGQTERPTEEQDANRIGAEVLVAWNERVLAVAEAEDGFLTLKGLRTVTLLHLAAHEALNAIEPRYAPYLPERLPGRGDPLAAVVGAAHAIAVGQYPGAAESFGVERDRWLAEIAEGSAKAEGLALGVAAAERVLAARQGDGWDGEAEYQWHPMGPGVYAEFAEHSGTPEGFVFGAGWAAARPFLLDSPSHFRAPPPPEIASEAYTRAYREVKAVGRFASPSRTADQTHLALWWKDFAENSHNRLARQLVIEEGMELWDAARLFALLNMSLYDAYINVFENKFLYNHWRPYTAIRWAAHDGNPDTEPDPEWNNTHRHTYAFPSYPSAHGTACAAGMTVLARVLGPDRPFTMTTAEVAEAGPFSAKMRMDPPTRSFDSFAAAAMECALSRVYLGIHFRYDSVAGNDLGTRIGEFAVQGFLQPSRP